MDLAKYQELTGTTVADSDVAKVTATIRRANSLLESALGYSLAPSKNLDKQELGKVQFEGISPYSPLDLTNLLPADEEEGSYRLFSYNVNDPYIKTDPCLNVYHVKLVQAQNDDEFVTFRDLTDFASMNTRKFSKFINKQVGWFQWNWYQWLVDNLGHGNRLLVAVDGDWLTCNNMPSDLYYLWADMVTYYSDDDVSVTGNIKSESVNGHSWTKSSAGSGGTSAGDLAPEQSATNAALLKLYAGPNGTAATRIPTI